MVRQTLHGRRCLLPSQQFLAVWCRRESSAASSALAAAPFVQSRRIRAEQQQGRQRPAEPPPHSMQNHKMPTKCACTNSKNNGRMRNGRKGPRPWRRRGRSCWWRSARGKRRGGNGRPTRAAAGFVIHPPPQPLRQSAWASLSSLASDPAASGNSIAAHAMTLTLILESLPILTHRHFSSEHDGILVAPPQKRRINRLGASAPRGASGGPGGGASSPRCPPRPRGPSSSVRRRGRGSARALRSAGRTEESCEWSTAHGGAHVRGGERVGPVLQQRLGAVEVAPGGRQEQRGLALVVPGVRLRRGVDQRPDALDVPAHRRAVERGLPQLRAAQG